MSTLHRDSIIIDGLNISKFERSVFEDMHKGGITASNCTVSVWENFTKTVDNIGLMKKQIRDNGDLLTLVRTTDDIFRAKKEGKLCYMFAGWFAGAMDWVNDTTPAGKGAPRAQSKEVQCAAEGHDHCIFEVSPIAH